jgi:YD repeat-containing protein
MKRYLYLFILIVISTRTWAQSSDMNVELSRLDFKAKQVIPPAPEAAELGRYGNTPVSLFAGATNISIPLYELKGQFLSLPISMSYNASGFKPEDPATWVGLNWSLNAGGVVARSVSGNPDNETNYFGTNNLTFPNSADLFEQKDFIHDMKIGIRETDPDFYSYNFPGGAGKFFLFPNYDVLKKDRNNLKISGCFNCTSSYVQIVDEQGSTYTFGDAETTRLLLGDDEGTDAPVITGYNYPSSWYLSTITSVNGREKLLFEYYTTGEHLLTQNARTNKSVTYSKKAASTTPIAITFDSYVYINQPPATYTKRKFLKRVTLLRDGRIISYVDFQSASNVRLDTDFSEIRLLQGIKVYSTLNNVSKLVKSDTLYYGYFNNNSNTFTKNRLRLDSLKELPVGTATLKPPYKFEYNATGNMPERFPYALDHWGFYNASNNQSLVPTVVYDGQTYGDGANREPSLAGSSYGILNKLSYPTGGYTTFDYELNEGLYTNFSRKVGGLRIKQITDYAASGQKATAKIYEYKLDNDSTSGLSDAGYPEYLTPSRFDHAGTRSDNPSYAIWKKTVSANSIFGLGTFHGSHIGYTRVTESVVDVVSGAKLGKTVYEYNSASFNPYDEDIRNGDLLKQTTFDNSGKVLEEQSNTYTYADIGGINMAKLRTEFAQTDDYYWCRVGNVYTSYSSTAISPPTNCDEQRVYYYNMLMDKFVLNAQQRQQSQQIIKRYDQLTNSYLTSTRKFTYGSTVHTYPTVIEDYTTGNEEVVTRKKYAGDYVIPLVSLDNTARGISNLQVNNMLTKEIESVQYRQNPDSSNRRFVTGQITNYGTFYPLPVSIYRLETATPLSTLTESTINSSGVFVSDSHYKTLGVFGYDGSGNLTEQSKANDVVQSILYDYNDSYPVAAINNANQSNVVYTSFETDTIRSGGGWIKDSVTVIATFAMTGKRSCNLSSGRLYKLFTTSIAKPMIVAYWSRNGAITVKQNNTTNIAVTTTGSTVNGWTYYEHLLPTSTLQVAVSGSNAIIDELRLYPAEAQMTTYTYEPLIGTTSQTDSRGMPVSYEYDGYGRLINIKDEKGNIRQNMKYNYGVGAALAASAPTLFYNRDTSISLAKTTCTAGEPEIVTYKVSAGKYISAISQVDVNTKAGQDLTANGQVYANTVGNCFFYNRADSILKFKQGCPPNGFLPLPVKYRVAARKWRSPVSQAEADTLAKHDLRDNAQDYANVNGRCACSDEGQKAINGVCVTGTRVNIGSWHQSDGQWRCVYIYHFDADNSDSDEYTEYNTSQCPVL